MQFKKKANDVLNYEAYKSLNGGPSFSLNNRIIRFFWNLVWLIAASWTPPSFHRWRRFLLIVFGAKMGTPTDVRGSARVWYPPNLEMHNGALLAERVFCYNQAKIVIGSNSLVSQGAHLCAGTHDIQSPNFQLIAKEIFIGRNVWIAAEAFVGPGISIGDDSVLGARGVAFKNIPDNEVHVGNPAKMISIRRC